MSKMDREDRDEAKIELKNMKEEYKVERKKLATSIRENTKLQKKGDSQAAKGKANLKKNKQKLKDAKAREKMAVNKLKEAEKRYSSD